ncbi:unnamed protein product [Bursaphelenchus xylophilus]|uniref:(pine wood nematode) hypothetical protein n=1 Tax=Bursaphelenchus xylophilus TaxID=6326 RepID=A0A7I8XNQ1_BURXY|nr:unnamed protein product [Bursaphelenchus xylophilus]CAG9088223.1 unnamed protein product [Bursaphelenchus xylophilus]
MKMFEAIVLIIGHQFSHSDDKFLENPSKMFYFCLPNVVLDLSCGWIEVLTTDELHRFWRSERSTGTAAVEEAGVFADAGWSIRASKDKGSGLYWTFRIVHCVTWCSQHRKDGRKPSGFGDRGRQLVRIAVEMSSAGQNRKSNCIGVPPPRECDERHVVAEAF